MRWDEFKSDWTYFVREAILRILAISLIVFALVLMPIYFLYNCYTAWYPSDRVESVVENVQPDVNFLCIVADTSDGPLALDWYLDSILGRTNMRAVDCAVSY